MDKKVVIDKQGCIGCGLCVTIAPKSFKMGKDGKSEVIGEIKVLDKSTKEAIKSCPVGVIKFK